MSALALTFKIFRGDKLVREETLRQSIIKIGKVPSAHLRIDHDSVSRMHAVLEIDNAGDVHVIDLGSTRGTFINGHKVNKAKLESGDAIQVGDCRIEVAFTRTDAVIAAPVPTEIAPMPVAKPPVPPPHKALFGTTATDEDLTSAKAIEVAAMLGDSVIGVKHCIDPKSGKVSSQTYAMFAAGAACLVAAAIAFGISVHAAAFNNGGLDYTTHVLNKPAYSFRPEVISPAFDWLAFGGLAIGMSLLIAGLARSRGERRTPYYRIGTAPGVELALDSAPTPNFPLVAPSSDGNDFVFNYGAGMDGELVLDGKTTSFAELVAAGRARPSQTTAGALELPIPARARIRARSGQTMFVVSAVAQPRAQAISLLGSLESRTVKYFAGSLAVHLCMLAVLNTMQTDDGAANIEVDDFAELTSNIKGATAEDAPPEKPTEVATDGDVGATSQVSMKAPGEAGTAGRPDTTATNKRMDVKDNHTDPAIARARAIEEAKNAGILGTMSAAADNFRSIDAAADVSSGFGDVNAYGNMYGASVGDANGTWGVSRSGFSTGGDCTQEPCGTLGNGGKYNTISTGNHAGNGLHDGPGGGVNLRRHVGGLPILKLGPVTGVGDLDQATIRRYINRNAEKIRYCYEHELVAHPDMEGTILAQFFISPTGSVTASKGSGFNDTVAKCVGEVVGNIAFPRPAGGGGVQVNYPFTFHLAK